MQRNVKIINLFLISAELPNSGGLTDISRKQRAPFTVLLNERCVFRASCNTIFTQRQVKEAQTQAVIVIEWFITESKTHEDYSVAVFFYSFLSGNGRGAGLK